MFVIEENPASIAGVTEIMRKLHEYVPAVSDKLLRIPCHGDGLSCERMTDCQRHSSCLDTPIERLEGLVAIPQDFYRRMILLQVS